MNYNLNYNFIPSIDPLVKKRALEIKNSVLQKDFISVYNADPSDLNDEELTTLKDDLNYRYDYESFNYNTKFRQALIKTMKFSEYDLRFMDYDVLLASQQVKGLSYTK